MSWPPPPRGSRRHAVRRSSGDPESGDCVRELGPCRSGGGTAGSCPGGRRGDDRAGPGGTADDSAGDFFEGYLSSALGEDELLVGVRFPAWSPRAGWSVLEVSRRHGDFALVGLVTTLEIDEAGLLRRPALSFFGVAGTPVRVGEAEQLLDGSAPDPALFAEAAKVVSGALQPRADDHASSDYRAHVAGVLTRRGLAEAAARATERAGV